MRQVISFDRVKLTNNEMDDKGHVGNPSEHAQYHLITDINHVDQTIYISSTLFFLLIAHFYLIFV